jgi:hypothetical protein
VIDTLESAGDLGLHIAARTVLERCPEPTNALEVAVVLETCGYTSSRAARLGASSLMELGERVLALMPLYGGRAVVPEPAPRLRPRRRTLLLSYIRGLGASAPLLVGLGTTVGAGVSFWSSAVAIPSIAIAISLSTVLSLVLTAPFVQGFGRRAAFYLGLDDEGMLVFVHRWTLQLGLLATAAANAALYLVRNDILGVGSPAANRLGLGAGLAIGALQIGLASFYIRRAYVTVAAVVAVGSAAMIWRVDSAGAYVDPLALASWQLRLVAVMGAVTCTASAWWLLRAGNSTPAPVWKPRPGAFIHAVAPYAGYGLAYFVLLAVPQLVAGGAWAGHYSFDPSFALAAGSALVVLVPALALSVVAMEDLLEVVFPSALDRRRVSEVGAFRSELHRYWRQRSVTFLAVGSAAALALVAGVPLVEPNLAGGLFAHHLVLRSECALAMVAIGLASFASQLLLALSQPRVPLVGASTGAGSFVVASALASAWCSAQNAAGVGLLVGSALFAIVAIVGAERAFRRADLTYYRTM